MPRAVALAVAVLLVAGCTPARAPACPEPEVIRITTVEYLAIPPTLLRSCAVDCPEIVTNGDLLVCYHRQKLALELCNGRLGEISKLQ